MSSGMSLVYRGEGFSGGLVATGRDVSLWLTPMANRIRAGTEGQNKDKHILRSQVLH